jgi:hypothetical protein
LDSLATGLTDPANIDTFDCEILQFTQQYGEPDAMIFKAIIYVESRFQFDAVACTNLPCGIPTGWTLYQSQCFGLMQIVAACDGQKTLGMAANGLPDLSLDYSSSDWPNSLYNPVINIELGIAGVHGNRQYEMKTFPKCTTQQYTLMAVGDYNSYGSTKSCTEYNTAYDVPMLAAYAQFASAAGWANPGY